MRIEFIPEGPCPSTLMIVGEAPSEKDVEHRQPFTGTSGWLLDSCLKEAGLLRSQAFVTNVVRERPPFDRVEAFFAASLKARTPEHRLLRGKYVLPPVAMGLSLLEKEIAEVHPHVVIACGNVALWALTGKWGILKWRSSIIEAEVEGWKFKVIPVLHPAATLREWPQRRLLVHDLRRAAIELSRGPLVHKPAWSFILRPTFTQAENTLRMICTALEECEKADGPLIPIAADIETRAGHTACLGLAWAKLDAISIPWMCVERPEGYWPLEEELILSNLCKHILTHPKAQIIWQNGAYDHQYEFRWHFFIPSLGWDTMLAHHAMFSVSRKGLDHLSSLYCDYHLYWKEDGKLWDPSIPEDELWQYNCVDCVRTYEIAEAEQETILALTPSWSKLPEVVSFQHAIQPVLVQMMVNGVRSDAKAQLAMDRELEKRRGEIQIELEHILGQPINIRSPKQMADLFYTILHQSPLYSRKADGTRGGLTCDDEALLTISARQPVLRGAIARIQALRSAGVFQSTFVRMPRDTDGRIRCSYNAAGTKTYRLASSENAFNSGGNLQNIPVGDAEDNPNEYIPLPNIRRLFLFDPGHIGFDIDGDSADLRIVTGESGCRAMQAYFAAKVKPYVEIAKEFYHDPGLTKHSPQYKKMKALCHGSNYGGEAKGLSERIGLPVHDIERMQRWYFGMCPEIKVWQDEIARQGEHRGWIENPFGNRLYNWDRWSRKVRNEFLAWTPQSTVGLWVNRILLAIHQNVPEVKLLLQVHDSAVGQFLTTDLAEVTPRIIQSATISIPCRHELVTIPVGLKTSTSNWGDCK
jgi:DNA polymerase I-like protein with 3'-5' exonuclease and polymerase domains/uracil-DNA glycosylase